MSDIEQLITERNAEYKDAWKTTGLMLKVVAPQITQLLVDLPEIWYCWVMVFNKAIRLLGNPRNLDSWKDIQGYSQLAIDHLDKKDKV